MIYSGDVDVATVPHQETQRCISKLNMNIVKPWRMYQIGPNPAGFVEIYDHIWYATVKGAGHEAGLYAPMTVYHLFSNFLAGTPF